MWVVSYDTVFANCKSLFPSPCGVWVVSSIASRGVRLVSFRPLAGCGLFRIIAKLRAFVFWFPSPCGVWVVSYRLAKSLCIAPVSVPLRGVGCFYLVGDFETTVYEVSVPLRGVGCFYYPYYPLL